MPGARPSGPVIGDQILRLKTVASTMDVAAELAAAGAEEGLAVVADEQTAGRGRAGRAWRAPADSGVFVSVILRPNVAPMRLGCLALVVGVAVARALEDLGFTPVLKWPNDVWLDGKKVAGILVSSRVGQGDITAIAGIGINVSVPDADLAPEATTLHRVSGRSIEREDVLQGVLASLDQEYAAYISSAGYPDLSEWTARAAMLDEFVTVQDGLVLHSGNLVGIRDDGALLLRGEDGRIVGIVAGDLTRGPSRIDPSD